ncbi:MAG: partitioning protein, partial [Flavobacteriia bacterium]
LVAKFKKDFKKETLNKLLRFLLTRQVHLGESNHTNDLTNRSFYGAMHSFFKDKITAIEETYAERRQKRETRIKERVTALEQQAKANED